MPLGTGARQRESSREPTSTDLGLLRQRFCVGQGKYVWVLAYQSELPLYLHQAKGAKSGDQGLRCPNGGSAVHLKLRVVIYCSNHAMSTI
jgi:hypothetical protein